MVFLQIAVVAIVIMITVAFSGNVVRRAIAYCIPPDPGKAPAPGDADRNRIGGLVGKLENILVVLFVASGAITALAIVITAKSIARKKEIEEDPGYYLVGSMSNFTFSILMGFLARALMAMLLGQPIFNFE